MLRTPWYRLVSSSVDSLIHRFGRRVRRTPKRRLRRGHDEFGAINVAAEVLEVRQLLSAPMAFNDSSYSVAHSHTLAVTSGSSVLNNDMNMGMGTMTAVQYSSPSHGTISAFNSDGTFTYVAGVYSGTDSFQYQAHNNDGYSSPATITITVTNSAPSGFGESYTIYKDSQSISAGSGVLANDSDSDSDSLTAVLVSGPSHSSLTLNSDGSFTITPTAGYYGADSFQYKAYDGMAYSANQTVSLTMTDPFSAQTNSPDTPFNDYTSYGPFSASQLTGGVLSTYSLTPQATGSGENVGQASHDLVYSSLAADVKPIVVVEATFQGSTSVPTPDSFKVDLTFGGVAASTLYFNNSGLTGVGSPTVRIADQVNASSLATGRYQWVMTVTSYYGTGGSATTATRVYTGYQNIVNQQASPFGKGWNLAELDGLAVQSGGVLWYSGTGDAAWFASNGSGGYTSPAGPLSSSTLTSSGSVYTLTDKYGNAENFSSAGLLTSKVDANGNTTSYSYSSGKLSTITDPFGRTTSLNYTSGLVSSIVDMAGNTTTLAHSSTNLTSITAPVPATGVSAPVTGYGYTGNLLTTITDPLSHATALSYSYGDRISQATYADSTTSGFTPAEMTGLVDTTSGTGLSSSTPATPNLPGSIDNFSSMLDPMSHTTSIKVDGFGNIVVYTDPLSLTTTCTYNSNGQMTQMTQPSPGTGISAPVTSYSYDSHGNQTQITHPDGSTDSWTYGTSGGSLNRPLTHTDQRGKTTTYTYDSHGNVLTITDALSNVTTLTYTSIGLVASITAPNPSTGGASGGLVTSFTRDSYGRVTRITNPDSTHKDFTYDSADNLLTSTDELSRVTTMTYDHLSRLLTVTLPDPDGAGSLTSPVTNYSYDAAGQLTGVSDALGYITAYAYNSRGWLTTETLPDPDGVGSLTSPVITIGYNANGWKTSETDPLGNVTTYAYNNDGWLTSITAPDPDGAGSLSSPVTSYTYDNLGRLSSAQDPNSHTTSYAYNSLNQVTSVTDALSKVTGYTHDVMGNVLTITAPDPDGAGSLTAPVTTYTYTDVGQLATTTDALGYVTTNAYDHDGRLTSVTAPDPDGAGSLTSPVTSYTWDSLSRLSTQTDPLGYVTTYGYDNASELTSVTAPDPDGAGSLTSPVTGYTYDNLGRITVVTDANSHTTQYAYDADSRVTSVTDGMGYVTAYAYDHLGRVTSRTDPDPDGAGSLASPVTNYAYNADSQVTSKTDPLSQTTNYAYDNDGRLTSVTEPDPDGGGALTAPVTSYQYDAASNVTKVTDPLGFYTQYAYDAGNRLTGVTAPDPDGAGSLTSPVTSYTYDYMGRLTIVSDPLSHTTTYAYDADSRVSSVTDGLGYITAYAYDHLGRVTSVTDPDPDGAGSLTSPVTSYAYNADSQVTSKTDPLSQTTGYAYDHDSRLTGVTDAASHTTSYAHDAAGNTTSVTDALGYVTAYAFNADNWLTSVTAPDPDGAGSLTSPVTVYGYDHLGRTITVTDPLSGITSYAYDADGNLTSVTDSVSNATSYSYDHLNRMTSEIDAASHSRNYVYDADSRLTSETDRNSRVTNFAYDNLGRMTQEQWMSGGTAIYTASYAYNAASLLTSASDGNSAYAYTYNADNSVTQVDNSGTPTGPHVILNIGYDHMQRQTSESATVNSTLDLLNNYAYNADSQLTQITQQGQSGGNSVAAKRIDLTYTAIGEVSTITRYANTAGTQLVATSTYGYDVNGQATSLSHVQGATTLASYTWTYDHIGRLTADTIGAASDSFSYDATSQVTAATHSGGGNESYSYDANGNRTNTGYSTTTNNKLASDGTYNYTYDNEGNLTKKTTISSGAYATYTWDYHNRLTDVKTYNSSNVLQSHVNYVYDVFNRLIEKQVDPTGGGTYTSAQSFIYDSSNNVVLIYNGSGTLTDRFVNSFGLNQALADENGSGTVSWFLKDREGTTGDVVQYNSGTGVTSVVDHLTFDSFGNITAQTNSANQPLFAYTGQMWDATIGLYYYHARWYDPHTGRFISPDPTSFAAGDANLYRYVGNSPTGFVDPKGMHSVNFDSESLQMLLDRLLIFRPQFIDLNPFQDLPSNGAVYVPAVGVAQTAAGAGGTHATESDYQKLAEQMVLSGFTQAPISGGIMDDLSMMMKHPMDTLVGGLTGYMHGLEMIMNKLTCGLITPLNSHVDDLIAQNGENYATANSAAGVGVAAGTAALPCGWAANTMKVISVLGGGRDVFQGAREGDLKKVGFGLVDMMPILGKFCFVAGTQIVVGIQDDDLPPEARQEPIEVGWIDATRNLGSVLCVGIGIVAFAAHQPLETCPVRRRRRMKRREIEEVFGSFDDFEAEDFSAIADEHREIEDETPELPLVLVTTRSIREGIQSQESQSGPRFVFDAPASREWITTAIARLPAGVSDNGANRPTRRTKKLSLARYGWLAACLLFAAWLGFGGVPPADQRQSTVMNQAMNPAHAADAHRASPTPRRTLVTRPIEEIQVGQRVVASNPQLAGRHIPQPDIDPEMVRLVVLRQAKPDGDELMTETLIPLETLCAAALERLADQNAKPIRPLPVTESVEDALLWELLVGQKIEFSVSEIDTDEPATIIGLRPCPPLESDDGTGRRLVTSVYRHTAGNVIDLETSGCDEPIGTTANHPFWSEDRQEFVPAGELRIGENLRSSNRTAVQVTRITPHRGPPIPVFNFQVDGQHVYSVGASGLLVHNRCDWHHTIPKFLGGFKVQPLTALDSDIHKLFHKMLRLELKNIGIPLPIGSRNGSAAKWEAWFIKNPLDRPNALGAVQTVSRQIDSMYATHLEVDFLTNLMNGFFHAAR